MSTQNQINTWNKFCKILDKNSGANVTCDQEGDTPVYMMDTMMRLIQAGALAGTLELQSALDGELARVYIKNESGSDITIRYWGWDYLIQNGNSYAMSRETRDFLLEKAEKQGVTLSIVDLTEYLATGDDTTFGS